MVWDNFQRGQELHNQLCGRSSKFLIGTVEVAHHVVPFLQFSWDDLNIVMQYNQDQGHPSPLGMRAYEAFEWLKLNNKQFALYPSVRMLKGMS